MAVTSASVSVDTTITQVTDVDPTRRRVIFVNTSTTGELFFIGGSTVDQTSGVKLDPGERFEVVQAHREDTAPQQVWYAVTATAGDYLAVISVDN